MRREQKVNAAVIVHICEILETRVPHCDDIFLIKLPRLLRSIFSFGSGKISNREARCKREDSFSSEVVEILANLVVVIIDLERLEKFALFVIVGAKNVSWNRY